MQQAVEGSGDTIAALKTALGHAYSELGAGVPRRAVVERLRRALDGWQLLDAAPAYHERLAAIIAARSVGNRSAAHIEGVQAGLLRDVLDARG